MTRALTTGERISEILTLISLQVDRYGPCVVGQELAEGELIDFVATKDAEIARLTAEAAASSADAKAWRTLRRYERLLVAGFCSYADLNAAKAEAHQAAQEATL